MNRVANAFVFKDLYVTGERAVFLRFFLGGLLSLFRLLLVLLGLSRVAFSLSHFLPPDGGFFHTTAGRGKKWQELAGMSWFY